MAVLEALQQLPLKVRLEDQDAVLQGLSQTELGLWLDLRPYMQVLCISQECHQNCDCRSNAPSSLLPNQYSIHNPTRPLCFVDDRCHSTFSPFHLGA